MIIIIAVEFTTNSLVHVHDPIEHRPEEQVPHQLAHDVVEHKGPGLLPWNVLRRVALHLDQKRHGRDGVETYKRKETVERGYS